MSIVLRELADAQDAVQGAVRLVPVAATELCQPQGQVAVALDALVEDKDVRRAVHRLQRHIVGVAGQDGPVILILVRSMRNLVGDDEHVLAILAPVARALPLAGVHQLRGLHFLVAGGVEAAAHIGLELTPDDVAVGVPEDAAVRFCLEVEQVHLLADLAVVALGRFLKPDEMLVELLPIEPGRAVDARQHRVLGIAAPVGAGDAGQLERLRVELAGRSEVRPAAKIHPGPLAFAGPVHGDRLALGQLHHPLGLERLAGPREEIADLLAAPDFPHQRLVGGDDPPHLRFDCRQILLGEGAAAGRRREVVIETVVRRRAEGDLRAGEQVLHRLGQQMREVVADQLKRVLLVARSDEGEIGIAFQRPVEVANLAVDARRQRRLGQARPDRRGDIGRGRALRHFLHGAVGKADLEHGGHGTRT